LTVPAREPKTDSNIKITSATSTQGGPSPLLEIASMKRKTTTKKAEITPTSSPERRSSIARCLREAQKVGYAVEMIEDRSGHRTVRFMPPGQDAAAKASSWDEALSKNAKAKKRPA